MTLYETIFVRRSVRQYNDMPVDAAELAEIEHYLNQAKPLPGGIARFEIVDKDKLKGELAPYAILAHSDDSIKARINLGYTLQGMDLYLQSAGYGSIWCGMAAPIEPAADYRVLLGFGKTDIPLRKDESDFKRKKIIDISNADNAISRAARLAPSAVNFQPWLLTFTDNKIVIRANARGLGKILPGKFYLYDIGIITKHVEVALEHEGKTVTAIEAVCSKKDIAMEVRYK